MAGRFHQEVVEGRAAVGARTEAAVCLFRGCCRAPGRWTWERGEATAVPCDARDAKERAKLGQLYELWSVLWRMLLGL